jgi:hypothetical protein
MGNSVEFFGQLESEHAIKGAIKGDASLLRDKGDVITVTLHSTLSENHRTAPLLTA